MRNLRHFRKANRLTQRQLALLADVDSTIISRIERGEFLPSNAMRSRIARTLGVTVFDLAMKP